MRLCVATAAGVVFATAAAAPERPSSSSNEAADGDALLTAQNGYLLRLLAADPGFIAAETSRHLLKNRFSGSSHSAEHDKQDLHDYTSADTDGAGAVPGTTVRLLGADSALPWVPQLNSGHEASYPTLQEGMAMLEEWVGKFPSCVRKEQVGESFEKRPLWVFKIACYEGVEEKEKGVVGETRHLAVGETQAGEGTTQSSQGDGVEAVLPKVGVDDEQRPSAPLEDTLPTAKRRTATAAPPTTKRPRFLLTSLTHSREPAGLVVVLYYIGNLLFNKAKNDPDAAYILNAREIYAFPFVNPDGYVFNEHSRTRMKRKNMRPSCPRNVEDGGVDLNRNFPTAWKKIRNGCSEEYSGTHAFSEPETIAIKELVEKVKFTVCANLHAYGSMLTHPYNYKKRNTLPKDDTAIYTEINKVFKYSKFGTAQQTVGYTAFGESDDWLYDQGIISMSPEVGHEEDGFWPRKGKIMGIVERNYLRMRYLTLKAGCELEVTSIPSPSTPFAVEIYNRGLVDCASPTIAITFSEPIPTAYFKVGSLRKTPSSSADLPPAEPAATSAFASDKTVILTLKAGIPKRKSTKITMLDKTLAPAAGTSTSSSSVPASTTIQAWCAQEKSFAGLPCQCRTQPVERSETSFQDAAKFDLCNAVAVKSPDGVDRGVKSKPPPPTEWTKKLLANTDAATTKASSSELPGEAATNGAGPGGAGAGVGQTPTPTSTSTVVTAPTAGAPASTTSPTAVSATTTAQNSVIKPKPPGADAVGSRFSGFFSFGGKRLSVDMLKAVGLLSALSLILLVCNVHLLLRRFSVVGGDSGSGRHVKLVGGSIKMGGPDTPVEVLSGSGLEKVEDFSKGTTLAIDVGGGDSDEVGANINNRLFEEQKVNQGSLRNEGGLGLQGGSGPSPGRGAPGVRVE